MKTYSKTAVVVSAILMILTGMFIIFNPKKTVGAISWIIGLMALISGILIFLFYLSFARGNIGAGSVLFSGIADSVIGVIFLSHSYIAAQMLAFIAGIWLALYGTERFVYAVDLKALGFKSWWLRLVLGIVCTIAGLLAMISPITAAISVSIVLGIGFIFHGASLIVMLFNLKD